jgi:hypothetical protein
MIFPGQDLLGGLALRLKNEAGIIITEFEPAKIRKQMEGNNTCDAGWQDNAGTNGDGDDEMIVQVVNVNGGCRYCAAN